MLLRMLLRWCDRRGFRKEILDYQPGEEAGVKSVTFNVEGDYAYGYLKAEAGIHRLVRISPFDQELATLDRIALDTAYKARIALLFTNWMDDQKGQPQRMLIGVTTARKLYTQARTEIDKRTPIR